MSSYADVELRVIQWAKDRMILQNGKPIGQARKTLEEAGELLEGMTQITLLREMEKAIPGLADNPQFQSFKLKAHDASIDAIGDTLVTLIVGAATIDVDVVTCLYSAYEQIKDRKGHLNADGVFVKEVKA